MTIGVTRRRRLYKVLWVSALVALAAAVVAALLLAVDFRRHHDPAAPPPRAETTVNTIQVGADQRSYRLYRPSAIDAHDKAPLVIMLHGALGSGTQAEHTYGWDDQADKNRFVVAYPEGYEHTWHVSDGCCGPAARDNKDDMAFIIDLVASLRSQMAIDPKRIYVAGVSNGGSLAYRLACETDTFAAIAPVATNMLTVCPSPPPVSVIHMHGLADDVFPYQGGVGSQPDLGAGLEYADLTGGSIPDLAAAWRQADHCSIPKSTKSGLVTTIAAKCPGGRAVTLMTVYGLGHQWPGVPPDANNDHRFLPVAPETVLNATPVIWQFFAAHPKP